MTVFTSFIFAGKKYPLKKVLENGNQTTVENGKQATAENGQNGNQATAENGQNGN